MRSDIPDFGELDDKCEILEKIAKSHPKGSPERDAVTLAAWAMHYVNHVEQRDEFRNWLEKLDKPLTALQILHAKLAGIDDLPHELSDETMREIDSLMERLRNMRS